MRILLSVALVLASSRLGAEVFRCSSGTNRVDLIELYTSEGCSSCPPAEAWLGSLKDKPGLWTQFVPVEFHVNYWDNLGWKDRLASPAYTAREYTYSAAWRSRNVYTPCFVRNGLEWSPNWGSPGRYTTQAGILTLAVTEDGRCRVEFHAGRAVHLADVHVALLGGGLTSRVTAGENGGATLTHEFVVLGLAEAPLESGPGSVATAVLELPDGAAARATRRAVAAWVTRRTESEPLQATGGWLP